MYSQLYPTHLSFFYFLLLFNRKKISPLLFLLFELSYTQIVCLGDYSIQWAKIEPILSGLWPIMLKMQIFLQVTEWCNHHNRKKKKFGFFSKCAVSHGSWWVQNPWAEQLDREMEKKKLTADAFDFNYFFFFSDCVHGLWPIFVHRISYKEFSCERSNYRSELIFFFITIHSL